MFAYYTRRLSINAAAKISCSLFCCLNLMIGVNAKESVFRLPIYSATNNAVIESRHDRQAMPSLSGEQAATWLEQEGISESLRSSIEASSYQIRWADGAYMSVNPAQNLSASFTPTQMSVAAGDEQNSQFGMRLTAFGYGQNLHRLAYGQLRIEGNRIAYVRKPADGNCSTLVEWYVNKAEGLEQGFTIAERTTEDHSGDRLALSLETTGMMKLQEDRRGIDFESKDGKPLLRYSGLHAYDSRGE